MNAHNPDVIERVAEAMYLADTLRHEQRHGIDPGVIIASSWATIATEWEDDAEVYRVMAVAALDAIDTLYENEGGEVPA